MARYSASVPLAQETQCFTSAAEPILRPLVGLSPRLDVASEQILLAQIEAFKPDAVLNQDIFYVDVSLMRRIGKIGRPLLIE